MKGWLPCLHPPFVPGTTCCKRCAPPQTLPNPTPYSTSTAAGGGGDCPSATLSPASAEPSAPRAHTGRGSAAQLSSLVPLVGRSQPGQHALRPGSSAGQHVRVRMPTPCPAPGCHAARLARAGVESGHQVRGGAPPLGFQSRAWAPLYTAASRFRATQRARGARGALAAGEGSRVHPEPRPVCWLGGGAAEGESLSGSVGHPDCSEPVCLTFAPVRAFTMASVPSAGCLLAKNQYYRSKLD
nr:pancreatic progenitor cell differentiation and proliferation factor-like protein isoform X3 [Caretta caretta]